MPLLLSLRSLSSCTSNGPFKNSRMHISPVVNPSKHLLLSGRKMKHAILLTLVEHKASRCSRCQKSSESSRGPWSSPSRFGSFGSGCMASGTARQRSKPKQGAVTEVEKIRAIIKAQQLSSHGITNRMTLQCIDSAIKLPPMGVLYFSLSQAVTNHNCSRFPTLKLSGCIYV